MPQSSDSELRWSSAYPATHEFVGVLEPRKSSFTLPAGITLQELGTIKPTAQFVALYGTGFCGDLMKRVAMSPQFEFMKPTGSRIDFFNELVAVYSRVLRHSVSESYAEADCCTATALECFLQRLQLEKLEEGEEMAASVIDLHAFVSGVDCFALMEDDDYSTIMPEPAHLPTMMNLPTQIHGSQSQAPPLPLPEEPEPSSQLLTVNVASLKEEIAGDIQTQVEKPGFLKDNRSFAQYIMLVQEKS